MGQIQIAQAVPISIHALREEGDHRQSINAQHDRAISIHALREEGDLPHSCGFFVSIYFYPRPP